MAVDIDTNTSIDLNTDAGEGFALPPLGLDLATLRSIRTRDGNGFHPRHDCQRYDDSLIPLVSSINLACGMHSGDPIVLDTTIRAARRHGIRMGAHPSYPDVFGFGQKRIDLSVDALDAVLTYQLGALAAVLARHGERIQHVKCHGALYFDVSQHVSVCRTLVAAMKRVDPGMILVLPSWSPLVEVMREEGIPVAEEIAIDRGYGSTGEMLPREHPESLITDPAVVADRLILLIREGILRTGDVETREVGVNTVCLHADTPGADAIAAAVVKRLEDEHIPIRPMGESIVNPRSQENVNETQ